MFAYSVYSLFLEYSGSESFKSAVSIQWRVMVLLKPYQIWKNKNDLRIYSGSKRKFLKNIEL